MIREGQIAANSESFLYVYEEKGRIVGSVHLHLCMDALSGDRPFAVLERVIVAPEMRGRGHGAALMRHAEAEAAARGALKVMLSSAGSRTEAHLFYERLGFDIEGTKKKSLKVDGQWVDEYYMSKILQ